MREELIKQLEAWLKDQVKDVRISFTSRTVYKIVYDKLQSLKKERND